MCRAAPIAGLLSLLALAVAGCGTTAGSSTVPDLVRAPPQSARLDWVERYPAVEPAIVFGVRSFTVTRAGWSAAISIENRSDVGWTIGDPDNAGALAFGVMLFPNDDTDELERRNRDGDLPTIRPGTRFEPALPDLLPAGKTWTGTMSAPGALAGGLWVRLSFGPFVSAGDPPSGTSSSFVWFTDHAYQLEQAETEPA